MATYSVVSSKTQTLGAGTVDIVNLSRAADRVTIYNTAATNAIYANFAGPPLPNGGTPTPAAPTPSVGGDNTQLVIPPNSSAVYPAVGKGVIGTVALISTGAQTYSVVS